MEPFFTPTLIKLAQKAHSEAFWVGGPVRDALRGAPCHDWDIACTSARTVARQAAKKLQGKFIVLDERHQIYRVVLAGSTLDLAELVGGTIEKDLARRDFTINAMAQRLGSAEIIDPFKGERDLSQKRLRAVSKKIFDDDPLRLLRAFRFAAQLQLKIEPQTTMLIRTKCHLLGSVAVERIREEWLRLLVQPQTAFWLREMDRVGLLAFLFPEIESCRRTAVSFYGRGGVLKHSLQTVENLEWILDVIASDTSLSPPTTEVASSTSLTKHKGRPLRHDNLVWLASVVREKLQVYLRTSVGGYPKTAWLKWAGFLHDVGKPATAQMIKGRMRFFGHEAVGADLARRRLQALRCSRQEIHWVGQWVQHHMRLGNLAAAPQTSDKAIARFFRSLGDDGGVGMLLVSLADHFCYLEPNRWGKKKDPVEKMMARMLESYYTRREEILPEKLMNGHELMQTLRIKPGPLVGQLLDAIQDAQSEGHIHTRKEALAFAKRQLKTQNAKRKTKISQLDDAILL